MPRDADRRHVIPLPGLEAEAHVPGEASGADDPWDPGRIARRAPETLRPPVLDLLGAMGVKAETIDGLCRELGVRSERRASPDELGAAISFVRSAVEMAAREGAGVAATRARHDCLDAACLAWAEDAVERQASAQRRFLRDVSHDIRSPLNSILFLADALRSRHSGELNPVQERQVDVLFMASVTLVKLVNDLIDYSHLNDDTEIRVASSPFSVEAVVEEVRSLVGPLLAYHEVEFEVTVRDPDPRLGDAQILNRILLNLVSNAVQAHQAGGAVHLEVWGGSVGTLEVAVTDVAAGEEDLERIRTALEKASHGQSIAETQGWTHGLGLSISARLASAAGGDLFVEPANPAGARLRLSLPFGAL